MLSNNLILGNIIQNLLRKNFAEMPIKTNDSHHYSKAKEAIEKVEFITFR